MSYYKSHNLQAIVPGKDIPQGILHVCPTPWCHKSHWAPNMTSPYCCHFCKNSGGRNHTGICIVQNSSLKYGSEFFFDTCCQTQECFRIRRQVNSFRFCCEECITSDGKQHSRECQLQHTGVIQPDRIHCITNACGKMPYQAESGSAKLCCRTCFLTLGRQHDTSCDDLDRQRIDILNENSKDTTDSGASSSTRDDTGPSSSKKRRSY